MIYAQITAAIAWKFTVRLQARFFARNFRVATGQPPMNERSDSRKETVEVDRGNFNEVNIS